MEQESIHGIRYGSVVESSRLESSESVRRGVRYTDCATPVQSILLLSPYLSLHMIDLTIIFELRGFNR